MSRKARLVNAVQPMCYGNGRKHKSRTVNWELVNMDEIFPSESTFQVTRCTRTGSDLLIFHSCGNL
jgi:hypothetical protein